MVSEVNCQIESRTKAAQPSRQFPYKKMMPNCTQGESLGHTERQTEERITKWGRDRNHKKSTKWGAWVPFFFLWDAGEKAVGTLGDKSIQGPLIEISIINYQRQIVRWKSIRKMEEN